MHNADTCRHFDCSGQVAKLHERIGALIVRSESERERMSALVEAARAFDDESRCHYDHEGYCQAHYVTKPCIVAVLRDALKAYDG